MSPLIRRRVSRVALIAGLLATRQALAQAPAPVAAPPTASFDPEPSEAPPKPAEPAELPPPPPAPQGASAAEAKTPTSVLAPPPPSSALSVAGGTGSLAETPEPAEPRTRWYGWQTLAVDGAAVALLFAAAAVPPIAIVSAGGYLLGPPLVHMAHKNYGRGFISLGLRVTLPIIGIAAAAAYANDPDTASSSDSYLWPVYGALVGVVSAQVIDAAALAYVTVPAKEVRHLRLNLALDPRGPRVGVGGSF